MITTTPSEKLATSRWLNARRLTILGVAVLAAIALVGNPFFYDAGNSGRYLIGVLRIVDPELFPNDLVADGLSGFESIFYNGLGLLLRAFGAAPELLEPLMFWLYVVARILLFVLLFLLVRTLTAEWWAFLLLAAWAIHAKALPLGGTQLFANTLRHTEMAFLFELAALYCLFRQRQLLFWLLASLAIFVHALLGLHFFLSIVPPLLLLSFLAGRKIDRTTIPGLAIAGAAVLLYYGVMAPQPFSAEEARIFLSAKGEIGHISFLGTTPYRWLELTTLLGLTTLAYWRLLKPDRHSALLLGGVFSGALVAIAFSALAIVTGHPLLALVQPLRIFLWVTFFAHFLLALAAGRAWRDSPVLSVILLAFFALSILDSYWRVAFAGLGILYMALPGLRPLATHLPPPRLAIGFFCGGMAAAAILGRGLPENAGTPILVAPAVALTLLVVPFPARSHRWLLAGALLAYSLVFASTAAYAQYAALNNPDWDAVCRWAQINSDKDDAFIATYTAEEFRVRSFRTAASHNYSALAWVDPRAFTTGQEQATRIQQGRDGDVWDTTYLLSLAQEWGVEYVILDGPYEPAVEPIFQAGRFSVIVVPSEPPGGLEPPGG
ncbi:MAG: hypothetical protein L0332_03390 [Chloroflexi bacterium]|nr:hypothetical protein [Chloroflexota bacterium]MCI0579660.1 hypothetical protein [Chloroflexota bacterium]MCI0645900.1 hypothetical protein [Chloroflexota bacterium]MCI0725755.1 hypothetical protein [Chloroflexota bacterium]